MADIETQKILRKNKIVPSQIALRKCKRIFLALFVKELFWGKCDSRSRENPIFLVQCLKFDFQFLAPLEDLDMTLEYHTVVVLCLFFWFLREIDLVLRMYLVYNTVVWLCQFFVVLGKLILYEFSCWIQIFFSYIGNCILWRNISNSYVIPQKASLWYFLANTLLLYIHLLTLTDRWNHRQRVKYTHCAWAGRTFFPVVLLCQFLVLAGNRCWFSILMYLEYNTVVMLC